MSCDEWDALIASICGLCRCMFMLLSLDLGNIMLGFEACGIRNGFAGTR